jgi:HTH-type transcriptional regulator / antitoxin HigA
MKKAFSIKPIKTRRDYSQALRFIEDNMDAEPNTLAEERLEVVAILVEKYEEEHFPIKVPSHINAIRFRMEQMGLSKSDLAIILGGKNRVSEVFSRKRRLSRRMVISLNRKLKIPADLLL